MSGIINQSVARALLWLAGAALSAAAPGASSLAANIFDDEWETPKPAAPSSPRRDPIVPPAPPPRPVTPPNETIPPTTPLAPVPEAPKVRPIPPLSDQARSRVLLRDVFAKDLADRSAGGRRQLALRLIDAAIRSADNAADQYVLLGGAISAAQEGSSLPLIHRAVEMMAGGYEVDALPLKAGAATKMVFRPAPPSSTAAPAGAAGNDNAENLRLGLQLADELLAADDFASAGRLCSLLAPLAAKDQTSRAMLAARAKDADAARAASERAAPSIAKLQASPDDPAANLAVGRYLCIDRGRWEEGLPLLAKGSDAPLKALAAADLANPADAAAQAALADRWWDEGERAQGQQRNRIRMRAAHWYAQAAPNLNGLVQIRAEGRLKDALAGAGKAFDWEKEKARLSYEHIAPNFSRASYAPYIDEPATRLLDGVLKGRKNVVGWQGAKPNLIRFKFATIVSPRVLRLRFVGNEGDPEVNVPGHVAVYSSDDPASRATLGEVENTEKTSTWIEVPLTTSSREYVIDMTKHRHWTLLAEVEFR